MRERLQRCDAELRPLAIRRWSCELAREHVRSFNADVADVRAALLEPALDLAGKGAPVRELAACLERKVAELAFWRRVLRGLHGDAIEAEPDDSGYLVRWLTR